MQIKYMRDKSFYCWINDVIHAIMEGSFKKRKGNCEENGQLQRENGYGRYTKA